MTPAKRGTRGSEFLRNGAIELFRVQRPVFTDRVAQQQIQHRTRRMAQLAVTMNHRAGFGLEISANCLVGFLEQRVGITRFDFPEMPGDRQRLPIEEISAARRAVQGHLIRAENQARKTISRVADARHIAPGVGRVGGVDADRVAVHAAQRFARHFIARRPAHVTQDQLIGSQRDRFAYVRW